VTGDEENADRSLSIDSASTTA